MGNEQPQGPMRWLGRLHQALVFGRRTRVLAKMLAARIPERACVLDVGCGDGTIGGLIAEIRPDIVIQGVEVAMRPGCKIACTAFDGRTLPFPDSSFDICIFVDVLHHTDDVVGLLREASRVSRSFVLIKDHLDEGRLDDVVLRLMDWVGNRPHGVRLPYNYQSREQWEEHFQKCGLERVSWTSDVPIYPPPLSFVTGRKLHFVALLKKTKAGG